MNEERGKNRLYAPNKQKKKNSRSKSDDRSTRFAMPFDQSRVYSPANQKQNESTSATHGVKPAVPEKKKKTDKNQAKPRFVSEKPVKASTRFVMPLDEKNVYRIHNDDGATIEPQKPSREVKSRIKPANPKTETKPAIKKTEIKPAAEPKRVAQKPAKPSPEPVRKAPVTQFVKYEPKPQAQKAPAERTYVKNEPQINEPVQKIPVKKAQVKKVRADKPPVQKETKSAEKAPKRTAAPKKRVIVPAVKPKADKTVLPETRLNTPAAEQSTKKQKNSTLRYVIALTLACMGALACMLILIAYIFTVKKITVVGAMHYDEEYILQLAEVRRGDILLLENPAAIAKRLNTNPYIQAKIQKKYPNELVIIIEEKYERAYIELLDGCAVIDVAGTVLKIQPESEIDSGLLKVTGMSSAGLKVGVCLADVQDYQVYTMVTLIAEIDNAGLADEIVEINMANPFGIHIKTAKGIDVYLGEGTELPEKLANVIPMCEKLISMGYGRGTLDLSDADKPVYDKYGAEIKATPIPATDAPAQTPDGNTDTPVQNTPEGQPPATEKPRETSPATETPKDTAPATDVPTESVPVTKEPNDPETNAPESSDEIGD